MDHYSRRTYLQRIGMAGGAGALSSWCLPRLLGAVEGEREATPSAGEQEAIAEIAGQFMSRYKAPGLSVAYYRHGQFVYAGGFGFADVEGREQMTSAHRFRIASISKPITSVAVYTLIEQGRLKLDATVFGPSGVLGAEFGNAYPPAVNEIRIHHLLTHTGGGWAKGANDPMFLNPRMPHRELIAWTLSHQPLVDKPGARFAYSNFGYCILGRVVERITGQRYIDFVGENVLAKCGIKDMQLGGNTRLEKEPGEVAYYGQDGETPYGMNIRRMDSHGGWIATPSDLAQFATHVDGFTTTPNILKAETIKTMTTATAAAPDYASGWCVNKVPNWWHDGSLPGVSTIMVRTASGLCWAGFANTRANGIGGALDELMWKMARAVPAWRA